MEVEAINKFRLLEHKGAGPESIGGALPLISSSTTSVTISSRRRVATAERRERLTLDAALGSPAAHGGEELMATVPTHRLDNKGGQNLGRRPINSEPARAAAA